MGGWTGGVGTDGHDGVNPKQTAGEAPPLCFWIKHSVIIHFVLFSCCFFVFVFPQLCTNVFVSMYVCLEFVYLFTLLFFLFCVCSYFLDILSHPVDTLCKKNHVPM